MTCLRQFLRLDVVSIQSLTGQQRKCTCGAILTLLLGVIAFSFLFPVFAQEKTAAVSDKAAVKPEKNAGYDDARIDAELSGALVRVVLVPRREAILSAETSGKVQKLHQLLGAGFAEKDELVTLEDAFFLAALSKSKSSLKAATVALESLTDLRTRNDASLMELENARRDVAAAQAELELAKRNFNACHVLAPYAGRVADVFLNEYELVEPGRPLLRVIDDRVLLGHVFLPGALYTRIRDGLKIPVYIERDGKSTPAGAAFGEADKGAARLESGVQVVGEFCRISPVIDSASGFFEAYVQIDNSAGSFRAGMEAWIRAEDLPGGAPHE